MTTLTIDELLQTPYWIVDILPRRVPADGPGQYFAVDAYWRREQLTAIRQKRIQLLLKLNCYEDLTVATEEAQELNPAPARLAELIHTCSVRIMTGGAMFLSDPDDTYMTLFNPDDALLEAVRILAGAEGLFVWEGADGMP